MFSINFQEICYKKTMTDPNGWVAQPPSTIVKVVNTSREALNGKLGIVLAYQNDRGRYVVLMSVSQEQVSLKPDNLVKGSWIEQMQAQVEVLRNNPQVQQHIQSVYRQVQRVTGVKPEYVAGAAGVAFLAVVYLFGFSRTMMIVSFAIMMGLMVQPDLQAGASLQQIIRNAPMRFKAMIRENVPMVGSRIANSNLLSTLAFLFIMFFFVNAIAGGKGTPKSVPPPPTAPGGGSTPFVPKPTADRGLLEDYYKMGFEDAKAGNDFGFSLPEVTATPPKGANPEFDWPGSDYVPPPPPKASPVSKLTSWSSLLSLYFIGNTLYNAGKTVEGGFDPQLMVVNLRMLDVWKQGMLVLSLYRLFAPLFS